MLRRASLSEEFPVKPAQLIHTKPIKILAPLVPVLQNINDEKAKFLLFKNFFLDRDVHMDYFIV